MLPERRPHLIDVGVCLLVLLSSALLIQTSACRAAEIAWTNAAGGNWNDPNNWNPNQVPGSADTASITNPGTYVVTLITNGTVGNLILGGAGFGIQTLQASGGFTLVASNVSVDAGGVLVLTNETLKGTVTVASGGVLSCYGSTLSAAVTVQSGAQFLVSGSTILGEFPAIANTNNSLWVQSGGELATLNATLHVYCAITNAGVANFITNSGITIYNDGTSAYRGGMWNQPSGVMNFMWNASNVGAISGSLGADYLVNEGAINVSNYYNTSITVTSFTNVGTVAVRSSFCTLRIGTFNGLGSLMGTYNAPAGTTIQFVAGNDPGISPGTPLVLGGAGRYQFLSGTLTLPTDVVPGLVMKGDNLLLGAGFQGGAITNLALDGISLTNNLPIAGTLVMTNGTLATTSTLTKGTVLRLSSVRMYGTLDVAAGGLLDCNGSTLYGDVTIESGGEFRLEGSGSVITQGRLWVQSGGEVDSSINANLGVQTAMTNEGLANFTTSALYGQSIWNLPGGMIDLIGNGGISGGNLINQGTINAENGNSTINVSSLTNLGTIATLPGIGTLRIGTLSGLGSLFGTYNAAAGTAIQFFGSWIPGTSAGTPLVLGGAGQYLFASGTLILPTDVIPGLVMTNGNLLLGAGFQGGAITNLALDGISLSNNLPISGTLTMTNGMLATTSILSNGTVLTLNGVTMYGAVNVAAGGLLTLGGCTLAAQVTVQGGGEFFLFGRTTLGLGGQASNTNHWLWVQSGGELDAAYDANLYLFSAMTNAGLVNMTNYGITLYNDGSSGYHGSVWNQAGGVMNLLLTAGIFGGSGLDYVVNQGAINSLSAIGSSTINVDNFTNAGVLNALYGTLDLQAAHLVLEPSGTLSAGLSSANNYGVINIPGNAPLGGLFGVTLNNGFVPPIGASFNVLTYGSFSGAFSDTNFQAVAAASAFPGLQHTVSFGTTYSSTFMTITVQQITEQFVFAGSNGPPGHAYVVLSSTDLALPRDAWTPVVTNYFDANGSFIFTTNLDPGTRQQFFTYQYH